MNTVIVPPPSAARQPAYLAALLAEAPAYVVGIVDAQKGETARPDLYDHEGDRAEYERGYSEERAAIAQFGKDGEGREMQATLDALFAPLADSAAVDLDLFDYVGELEDLLDGRSDEEHHARGMW